MSRQQQSASLEIVEQQQDLLEITQNSFQIQTNEQNNFLHHQKFSDTFELSLDQNSLSFQIQELNQISNCNQILKQDGLNSQIKVLNQQFETNETSDKKPLALSQQQRKRKRKQIFQKYKQKPVGNLLEGPQLELPSNDIMTAFDQIFKIKSPQKTDEKQLNSFEIIKKQSQNPQIVPNQGFKKKQSTALIIQSSSKQIPENLCQKNQIIVDPPLVCQNDNQNSVKQFGIPSNIHDVQPFCQNSNLALGLTKSFVIQTEEIKLSAIQAQQEEPSRDSVDIEILLKSQIFKDETLENTIRRNQTSYKSIEVSMLNPSIMLNQQGQSLSNRHLDVQQRFGLTRDKSEAVLPLILNKKELQRKSSHQGNLDIFQTIEIQPISMIKNRASNYEQSRIPIYLREIRKRNTIYPNFHFRPKNHDINHQQNKAFKELLKEFKKAMSFLERFNEIVYERHTVLTQLENTLLNSLTLDTFMNYGWERVFALKQIEVLKPRQNFLKRKYEYEKVKVALRNYLHIVEYYEKFNLNLQTEKGRKKYLQIRSKFWQIEKNLKMIGEDIYLLAVQVIFPKHYYEFLNILKGQPPQFQKPNKQLQYFRRLLTKVHASASEGDIVCASQIGKFVRQKLEKMIQKILIV